MSRRLTGFSPLVRNQIKERAGFDEDTRYARCEGCGKWYAEGFYELHHRIPRGSGGTKRIHVNLAANGLCFGRDCCHAFAESERNEAYDRGWLISQHRKNITPCDVPVQMHDGTWLLDNDGNKYRIPDRRAS